MVWYGIGIGVGVGIGIGSDCCWCGVFSQVGSEGFWLRGKAELQKLDLKFPR